MPIRRTASKDDSYLVVKLKKPRRPSEESIDSGSENGMVTSVGSDQDVRKRHSRRSSGANGGTGDSRGSTSVTPPGQESAERGRSRKTGSDRSIDDGSAATGNNKDNVPSKANQSKNPADSSKGGTKSGRQEIVTTFDQSPERTGGFGSLLE